MGVTFLQQLGTADPRLMITGKPLRDQGSVVEALFALGWPERIVWEVLQRPLPQPLRKDPSAIIAKRLRDMLEAPVPVPRQMTQDGEMWEEDRPTPTPRQYRSGDSVLGARYECDGDEGLCGRPVAVQGEWCVVHAHEHEPAW
ncbi:hypothetical protein HHL19_35200 [Streptomyces sp. R302]|uniref:hypothetical protein n=1 Tax=unclassified Streptomyces TaxID=2593676 RepID=UPI00145DF580|nr:MULTISPECIES: hypothetical protein [unclassified Streptomyces]NML55210.1 hypothetical protein [Streptomyces sp. R301]NML83760.1 hypothetical protein [Streptomyces sp. R302]